MELPLGLSYQVVRLKGVIAMIEDAKTFDDLANAYRHMETVHKEIVAKAKEKGIYYR